MNSFFDEAFLRAYLAEKAPKVLQKVDIGAKLTAYLERPQFEDEFAAKLDEISKTPKGSVLKMVRPMVGGSFKQLVPMMKPTMLTMAQQVGEMAKDADMSFIDVAEF